MKERIKELMNQASSNPRFDDLDKVYFMNESDIEKFAELVVQDCMTQIALIGLSNIENEDVTWAAEHSIKSIKEHFGISE